MEELEQTLFELRGQIGAGNHVPPGMRVLCHRDNPAQQWSDLRQSVMDRLKSENEALLKRLREVESSGVVDTGAGTSHGEELVPRESWEVLQKEKEELEEVVKQKEKRLLRLQQVCRSLRLDCSHSDLPGFHGQEYRVSGGDCVDPWTQARLLPEWPSEGDVDIRSVCVVCVPTVEQDGRGWGWGAYAARRAGRGWTAGSSAADALLGRGGGVHTWISCERDVGVLRQVEAMYLKNKVFSIFFFFSLFSSVRDLLDDDDSDGDDGTSDDRTLAVEDRRCLRRLPRLAHSPASLQVRPRPSLFALPVTTRRR